MDRNNFFAKFAHFYIGNFTDLKNDFSDTWEAVKELLNPLLTIIIFPLRIARRVLCAVFPVLQIWVATQAAYYTKDELPGLEDVTGKEAGYFYKKQIEKAIETERQEEETANVV
jgi:hypothetical protein